MTICQYETKTVSLYIQNVNIVAEVAKRLLQLLKWDRLCNAFNFL